jgi:hypothetical protein
MGGLIEEIAAGPILSNTAFFRLPKTFSAWMAQNQIFRPQFYLCLHRYSWNVPQLNIPLFSKADVEVKNEMKQVWNSRKHVITSSTSWSLLNSLLCSEHLQASTFCR